MKRFAIFLLLTLSVSTATFAQTKVNSGKNFVTYSYDSWDKAAEDFLDLCVEYDLDTLFFYDNTNFDGTNFFALKSDSWNIYIVRWVTESGIRGSLCISSPEGRQTELQGRSDSYKQASEKMDYLKENLNNLKLRYSFLGEPIP